MSAVSRRGLFAMLSGRKDSPSAEREESFSLDRFYEARSPQRSLPVIRRSATEGEPVETTSVGVTREPEGVVRIVPADCLGHTSFCSVCVERCPVEGAILLELGRPRVVETACTGCGDCVRACPAPRPALRYVSRETLR